MLLRHLTWIFAGLFVLCGAAIVLAESGDWRQFWAGLSALFLGAFALSMVRDAFKTGQIRVQNSVIHRASQPRLFRAAVILISITGAGVMLAGLWALFINLPLPR